jgi:NADPH:quinone reductase-like Zn-dependent oxidoreductase
MGVLSTRTIVKEWQILPIPPDTKHSLSQWAAFGVRYITAWSNWELAYGTFRLQLTEAELPVLHVWGWGGGTTFAELDLAARFGHRAVMLSGNSDRLATIARSSVTPLDRRPFGALHFDEDLMRDAPEHREAYEAAEAAFLAEVSRRTDGKGVHIFVDLIGAPVFRATLKALARQGVVTTAGWKHGMKLRFVRARECIERHQFINTHYARRSQAVAAIEFAERTGWMPPVEGRTFGFDEIPIMAEQYLENRLGMFPVFAVNPE